MGTERLQKILAHAGYGSRRSCEEMISGGHVEVDGRIAQLGESADPETQRITVDGVPVPKAQPSIYIMLNKPRGYISTTSDPEGRETVLDLLDLPDLAKYRLYPVGRLDAASEGLILLTNDGTLTQRLTHPRYEHARIYRVLVEGEPSPETLRRWKQGVMVEKQQTSFDEVLVESHTRGNTWLKITIHEGRKHIVRNMVIALGHPTIRLIRVEMGPLKLGNLDRGKWRYLTTSEVRQLQTQVGISGQTAVRRPMRRKPTFGQRSGPKTSQQRRKPR